MLAVVEIAPRANREIAASLVLLRGSSSRGFFPRSSNNFQLSKVRPIERRARTSESNNRYRTDRKRMGKKGEEEEREKERKNNCEFTSVFSTRVNGVRLIFSTVALLLLTFSRRILAFSTDVPLCNCFLSPII